MSRIVAIFLLFVIGTPVPFKAAWGDDLAGSATPMSDDGSEQVDVEGERESEEGPVVLDQRLSLVLCVSCLESSAVCRHPMVSRQKFCRQHFCRPPPAARPS